MQSPQSVQPPTGGVGHFQKSEVSALSLPVVREKPTDKQPRVVTGTDVGKLQGKKQDFEGEVSWIFRVLNNALGWFKDTTWSGEKAKDYSTELQSFINKIQLKDKRVLDRLFVLEAAGPVDKLQNETKARIAAFESRITAFEQSHERYHSEAVEAARGLIAEFRALPAESEVEDLTELLMNIEVTISQAEKGILTVELAELRTKAEQRRDRTENLEAIKMGPGYGNRDLEKVYKKLDECDQLLKGTGKPQDLKKAKEAYDDASRLMTKLTRPADPPRLLEREFAFQCKEVGDLQKLKWKAEDGKVQKDTYERALQAFTTKTGVSDKRVLRTLLDLNGDLSYVEAAQHHSQKRTERRIATFEQRLQGKEYTGKAGEKVEAAKKFIEAFRKESPHATADREWYYEYVQKPHYAADRGYNTGELRIAGDDPYLVQLMMHVEVSVSRAELEIQKQESADLRERLIGLGLSGNKDVVKADAKLMECDKLLAGTEVPQDLKKAKKVLEEASRIVSKLEREHRKQSPQSPGDL